MCRVLPVDDNIVILGKETVFIVATQYPIRMLEFCGRVGLQIINIQLLLGLMNLAEQYALCILRPAPGIHFAGNFIDEQFPTFARAWIPDDRSGKTSLAGGG